MKKWKWSMHRKSSEENPNGSSPGQTGGHTRLRIWKCCISSDIKLDSWMKTESSLALKFAFFFKLSGESRHWQESQSWERKIEKDKFLSRSRKNDIFSFSFYARFLRMWRNLFSLPSSFLEISISIPEKYELSISLPPFEIRISNFSWISKINSFYSQFYWLGSRQ